MDPPASDRQIRYIRSLLRDRIVPEADAADIAATIERGMTRDDARRVIDYLIDLPLRKRTEEPEDDPFRDDLSGDLSALAAQAERPAPSAQEAGR